MIKSLRVNNVVKITVVLLLAVLMLRCGQEQKIPVNTMQFTTVDVSHSGLDFNNTITETQNNNIYTNEYMYNGAGVAVGDINNDGLTDIYFIGNSLHNKLYLNKGDWEFEDITKASQTAGRQGWKTGVTMADVNGDGLLDIYICYSGNAPGEGYNKPIVRNFPHRANQLLINQGDGPDGVPVFKDQSKAYGLDAIGTFSTQAYFFDYDRDGDLDMLLLNHANMFYAAFVNTTRLRNLRHPYFGNKLYRNDNMKFVEVSKEAGLHGSGLNFGLSAAISDLNMDGWPDIYVTNDYQEQDFLYINNQDGTFSERSHALLNHMSKSSMGSDIADINNDGLSDIFVLDMLPEDNYRQKLLKGPDDYERYNQAVDSGYHHQYMRNTLQLNRGIAPDGLPRFSEIGQLAGISNTDWSWAALLVDLDNDGLRDIYITNGFLRDFSNQDMMNFTANVYNMAQAQNQTVDYLRLIAQIPATKVRNYVFRNTNGTHFENTTTHWGLPKEMASTGAAYADFDNDGDYDLVVNNLNEMASLYRNNQNELQGNNYLKIKIKGTGANTQGIGAKLWISTEGQQVYQEVYHTRGYLSSSDPVLTIGLGKAPLVDELKVLWPDGRVSRLSDVEINQTILVDYSTSEDPDGKMLNTPNSTLLKDVTSTSGLDFRHMENDFNDYERNKLLHYQLSRLGGKHAVGDVDGDGNDDVYFGGASGQSGALFMGRDDGTFQATGNSPWATDKGHEDMDALFFDADQDGDQDLYVVSGGNEFKTGSPHYQDRLYLNDGKGRFRKSKNALPGETTSGSCVTTADFDLDGDLDLFIGGRHAGTDYPRAPRSYLLRNDSKGNAVKFTDITEEIAPSLLHPGMVTGAIWSDFNQDNRPDLILVGEWMPVSLFQNTEGQLKPVDMPGLKDSEGWWSVVQLADIDGDGDDDYFLGNAGENNPFKASPTQPVELYAGDFNNDGLTDPLLCYYVQGKSYPYHLRDELLGHMGSLQSRFPEYRDYANATIDQLADKAALDNALKLKATILASCWLENTGTDMVLHKLPAQVQYSYANAFLFDDFDGDGKNEMITAGNFYGFKPQTGRFDASVGSVMEYTEGSLVIKQGATPLWLTGDVRDMTVMKFNNGDKRLIVSRNNNEVSVYGK